MLHHHPPPPSSSSSSSTGKVVVINKATLLRYLAARRDVHRALKGFAVVDFPHAAALERDVVRLEMELWDPDMFPGFSASASSSGVAATAFPPRYDLAKTAAWYYGTVASHVSGATRWIVDATHDLQWLPEYYEPDVVGSAAEFEEAFASYTRVWGPALRQRCRDELPRVAEHYARILRHRGSR